ncbi:tatD-related DNAse [Dictyostelium discoideum AX4]|uniref:TatD-related DNAse n=1 Tax=Dictyostelium discoideum TaxID=44689 RepID=Q55DK1_DICDI|nr:tatD-related DNAse [Dictyostelium discoideum AX4]EAL72165.2 tatD-related DNAse [Dictyostelium discoideum AX4]|eukprot:XP_646130.2 tatD-related DNAse [Dictyostelium discoideum AX4]
MNDHDDFPPLGSKPVKRTNNNNNNNNNNSNGFSYRQTTTTTQTAVQPILVPTIIKESTKNEIIDIGANLADKSFERDIDQILERGYNKGVTKIIITGTSVKSSIKAIQLIESNKRKKGLVELFSTVGVHPHSAEETLKMNGGSGEKAQDELRQLIKSNLNVVKSVGECGLDFNRNFSSHATQIEMFDRQIQLGIEFKLPLFIHERDAHKQFCTVVEKYVKDGTMPKSVIHCFTGTEAEARMYVSMGFYIGFTGVIGHDKRGEQLRAILKSGIIPLDRLMIETDCPYMTPHNINAIDKPKQNDPRSKFIRNEPSLLPYVLKTLAQCYNISEKDMALQTFNNTKVFFNLN